MLAHTSPGFNSRWLHANLTWQKLQLLHKVPAKPSFIDSVVDQCVDRMSEVFPQMELEAAGALNSAGTEAVLTAALNNLKARLVQL
jgi:hypothetical protein